MVVKEFVGRKDLIEANNDSKFFICTQCGECCHIREKKDITESEESAYKQYMYSTFGIIYLANLADITINVWPEEKLKLENEAKNRGLVLNIRPKRAVYNAKNNTLIILDYFIDHDICPFFDRKNRLCTVYNIRPLICQSYPLISTNTLGKCKYKKIDVKDYKDELIFAKKLEERIRKQKVIINHMIENNEIIIEPLSEKLLNNILSNANIVDLYLEKP